jgi:hypothetical protein
MNKGNVPLKTMASIMITISHEYIYVERFFLKKKKNTWITALQGRAFFYNIYFWIVYINLVTFGHLMAVCVVSAS